MANVMLVDVVRYKWFIVLAGIVGTILLSAVLLGALGPKTYDQHSKSAYNCVNGSHTYVPILCPGVQLGQPNQTWTYELPELSTLNGFWSLTMFPFNLQYNKTGLVEDLKVAVTVQGLKNNEWKTIVNNKVETEILLCDLGEPECWAFVLVYEDTVKYSRYQVSVSLPDTDNPGKQYVGDVEFRFSWYNVPFVEEQLALRVFFLVMATVCIFLFWLRMRATEIDQWSLEQKFMALLLLSLVALNNPFYPFEYLVAGWFFPTLDCLLQVIHLGVLQIFWLVMFDHVRRGDETLQFRKVDIIKPLCVGLYCALTLALFIWFRISHDIDPLFGQTKSINGMVVLFLACVLLFFGMMIWILVALMFAIPTVRQKRVLVARFMMLAIPTLVVLFSVVIGLFFGNFGPVRRSALSFVYYFTMYNVYVWVLLVAYWPVKSTFSLGISNPTEATPIFKDEKPSAVFETIESPSYDRS